MKLQDYICLSAYRHPTLYYRDTYEQIKWRVLDQAFLVLGNGMRYFHGGFFDHDYPKYRYSRKKLSASIKKRIFNAEPVVVIYNKIDEKLLRQVGLVSGDFNARERITFLKNLKKSKKKYFQVGQFVDKNTFNPNDYDGFYQLCPDREDNYDWHPYPFSLKHTIFYDQKKDCLIPKNQVQKSWREGIVAVYRKAKSWFEDDSKFLSDKHYNWADFWKTSHNALIEAWNKTPDKHKLCKDYAIPYKEYTDIREMARDIVARQRADHIRDADLIIKHFS